MNNNNIRYKKTNEYIYSRWEAGLRTKSNPDYPLPFPFEPPCVDGLFQCMFYWDTFFTNRGMILDDKAQYAKWNTDNLIHLLNTYGFVPNSNSYPGIKHNSQPPYLQYMIKDIYEVYHDDEWLKSAYEALKKEYSFWMKERMTPIGLNQYLHHNKTDQEKIDFYQYVCTRLTNLDKNAPIEFQLKAGASFNAACECGIDLTPTIMFDGEDMVEVDLNCHLYNLENYLKELSIKFEPSLTNKYLDAMNNRKSLMDKYMLRKEDNLYWDYNFKKNTFQQLDFHYAGQFWPFISGLINDKQTLKELLSYLEYDFGVAETQKYTFTYDHQGAYPYSWPFDNCFAFWALTKLGLEEDASRVGIKYLEQCTVSYELSGHLWEVYDVTRLGIAEKKEYPNTEMLGWTAGTYQWIYYYLYEGKRYSY